MWQHLKQSLAHCLVHALPWYNYNKASLLRMMKTWSKRGLASVGDITGSGAMDAKEDDDGIDLFGSEKENEEAKRLCSMNQRKPKSLHWMPSLPSC